MAFILDDNDDNASVSSLAASPEKMSELPPEFTDELRLSPMSDVSHDGSISPPFCALALDDLSLKSPASAKRRRPFTDTDVPPSPKVRKTTRSFMGARISELLSANAAQCFRDLLGPWGGVAWASCCRATRLVLYSWLLNKAYICGELNKMSEQVSKVGSIFNELSN